MKDKVPFFLDMSENARFNAKVIADKYPNALFIENKGTDTQGFILPSADNAIISFRGTQEVRDWATDLDGFHEEVPYGNYDSPIRTHRGMTRAYKSVRGKIHEWIKKNSPLRLYICGHSLGGALATLCAVDLQYNFPGRAIECYVSGNPKVGNKAFAVSYEKRVPKTMRTYMRTDLVPNLPPRWIEKFLRQKSVHCGQKNPIGPRNIFIGIINWISRRFETKRLAADLTNHSMALYKKYCLTCLM